MEETPKKKTRNRCIFSIPEDLHKEIKIRCINNNVSVTKYILQAVIDRINRDKQYQ
jgi:hypothetical protein